MASVTNVTSIVRRLCHLNFDFPRIQAGRQSDTLNLKKRGDTDSLTFDHPAPRGAALCPTFRPSIVSPLSPSSAAQREVRAASDALSVTQNPAPVVFRGRDEIDVAFACCSLADTDVTLLHQLVFGPWMDSVRESKKSVVRLELLTSHQLQSIRRFVEGNRLVADIAQVAVDDLRAEYLQLIDTAMICGSHKMEQEVRLQWRATVANRLLKITTDGSDADLIPLVAKSLSQQEDIPRQLSFQYSRNEVSVFHAEFYARRALRFLEMALDQAGCTNVSVTPQWEIHTIVGGINSGSVGDDVQFDCHELVALNVEFRLDV